MQLKTKNMLMKIIVANGPIAENDLVLASMSLSGRQRKQAIDDLIAAGLVCHQRKVADDSDPYNEYSAWSGEEAKKRLAVFFAQ
jgi:predicted transcriptional regulator